jgi:hypothetical protein
MSIKIAIAKLKEKRDLTIVSYKPDFEVFTTIYKGDAFKIKTSWKVNELKKSTYILSYNNSYHLDTVTGNLEYRPHYVTSSYLCCYVDLNASIPDTIVHPLSLTDKIVNILFHQNIKLKNKPLFNKKYLLQSVDKEKIIEILTDKLIDTLASFDDIFIEIRNNKCLIHYLRPVLENDGIILTEIAEKFETIKNVPTN